MHSSLQTSQLGAIKYTKRRIRKKLLKKKRIKRRREKKRRLAKDQPEASSVRRVQKRGAKLRPVKVVQSKIKNKNKQGTTNKKQEAHNHNGNGVERVTNKDKVIDHCERSGTET